MKSLRGPFVSVSEEAITLQVGKSQESIERAKVVRVSVRDTSHRTRNMLLGSGILGGITLAAAAISPWWPAAMKVIVAVSVWLPSGRVRWRSCLRRDPRQSNDLPSQEVADWNA